MTRKPWYQVHVPSLIENLVLSKSKKNNKQRPKYLQNKTLVIIIGVNDNLEFSQHN